MLEINIMNGKTIIQMDDIEILNMSLNMLMEDNKIGNYLNIKCKNDLESDLNILLKKSDQLNENSTPDQFDKFLHDLDYFIFDLDDYISEISNAMKSLGDIGNSLYEIYDFIHKNFISNDHCKK